MPAVPVSSRETLVTIIIPVRNTERYLTECLDSVLGQSHDRLQVIAVDDGSTDGSPRILEEHARRDARLTVFTQAHRGAGAARNRGLASARGGWIYFADSDDYLHPRCIERLLEAAGSCGADLVLSTAVIFDDQSGRCTDDPTYSSLWFPVAFDRSGFVPKTCPRKEDLVRVNLAPWAKLIDSDLAASVCFPENTLRFEDIPFVYGAVLKARRVSVVREQLYYHRQRKDSIQDRISTGKDPAGAIDDLIAIHPRCVDIFSHDAALADLYKRVMIDLLWQSYARLAARTRRAYVKKLGDAFGRDVSRALERKRLSRALLVLASLVPPAAVRVGARVRGALRARKTS